MTALNLRQTDFMLKKATIDQLAAELHESEKSRV